MVKQALAKLKVADDWFADVSRNRVECQALEYCAGVMPTAVPRLLHADPDVPLFVMEYLGQECVAWKTPLVEGDIQPAMASRSACAGSRARGLQSQEHPGLLLGRTALSPGPSPRSHRTCSFPASGEPVKDPLRGTQSSSS